jgi:hypothetical protein
MGDLDEVSERIEPAGPCDVDCAGFFRRPVEQRVPPFAHLDDEHVQIGSVRVSDQLLNLSP